MWLIWGKLWHYLQLLWLYMGLMGQGHMMLNHINAVVKSFKQALKLEPHDGEIKRRHAAAHEKVHLPEERDNLIRILDEVNQQRAVLEENYVVERRALEEKYAIERTTLEAKAIMLKNQIVVERPDSPTGAPIANDESNSLKITIPEDQIAGQVPDSTTDSPHNSVKAIILQDQIADSNVDAGLKQSRMPCGLLNQHNNCFVNVVLQCFYSTDPFLCYLLGDIRRRECDVKGDKQECFLCALQNHIQKARTRSDAFLAVDIIPFVGRFGLKLGQYEDAHEFMV